MRSGDDGPSSLTPATSFQRVAPFQLGYSPANTKACDRQWMSFRPPFLTVVEQFIKNMSSSRIELITLRINTKPSLSALGQPLRKRLPASDWADPSIPCHRRGERLRHGGDVCGLLCWWWTVLSVLFLSQESYWKGVFCSCRNLIAVRLLSSMLIFWQGNLNSLTAIDGHDRQYFNELRSTVVSCRIFIRSQSLIAH